MATFPVLSTSSKPIVLIPKIIFRDIDGNIQCEESLESFVEKLVNNISCAAVEKLARLMFKKLMEKKIKESIK